ncbi:F0F1 ATP synthase subunit epsilon [Afifella sp. IM 167]|uniref:F0F1 ATP synthase subunit epsilon n=1 Tax=Afifella sp. IM 167 TaxID=2033586 RepID=UPI001CC9FFF8|nr:F0F1 ATP synthase subunit epsilon [Afifella sp. IM 167]MBZ8135002.1 F0F1 ATP synthase subunit epsilon [Afifella sp. IM 167]
MADPFRFELVTPTALLVSEEADQVVVPGQEGQFTVLRQHAPFMTTLKPGMVEVTKSGGETERFYVRGGFADTTPESLTILADEAVPETEVNADLIEAHLREAEEELEAAGGDFHRHASAQKRISDLHDVRRWIIPA